MAKTKRFERRAAKRAQSAWRDPAVELPDADIMVLLLVDQGDDEPYVTAGYDSGRWHCAVSAKPITGGCVTGWMHMDEAVAALRDVKRVEVAHA